jgi:hypothetical protein
MSHTFPNINTVAPYLDNLNSRLFFRTVLPGDSFDEMKKRKGYKWVVADKTRRWPVWVTATHVWVTRNVTCWN